MQNDAAISDLVIGNVPRDFTATIFILGISGYAAKIMIEKDEVKRSQF